MKQLSER
jgi:hypothetical protein